MFEMSNSGYNIYELLEFTFCWILRCSHYEGDTAIFGSHFWMDWWTNSSLVEKTEWKRGKGRNFIDPKGNLTKVSLYLSVSIPGGVLVLSPNNIKAKK